MNFKYTYRVVENVSIEFLGYPHDDPLIIAIYSTLKEINVPMISLDKVWKLDDLTITEDSDYGKFEIIKNLWGDIFIFPKENIDIITIIDKLLTQNENFIKN